MNKRYIIEATPLDEMINGDQGEALSEAGMKLSLALLGMPAGELAWACTHDHRLSDEVRAAARDLSQLIVAQGDEPPNWEDAAYAQADWERNCAKEAELY